MNNGNGNGDMMPGSMDNGTNMNMDMKDMAMHMSFYWGKNAIILFPNWPDHSLGMYILSLFFVFFLSFAVEVLSVSKTSNPPRGTAPVIGGLIQAAVYALRTALGYMVMLSVMSFNVGIFIAAVIGHTVGFFLVKYRELTAVASRAEDAMDISTPKV